MEAINSSVISTDIALEEKKARAKEIYMTIAVVSRKTIAKRVGATPTQIKQWCDEGGWLEQRLSKYAEQKQSLIKRVGTPKQAMEQELEMLNQILEMVKHNMERSKSEVHKTLYKYNAKELQQYAHVVKNVNKMRTNICKTLKLSLQED